MRAVIEMNLLRRSLRSSSLRSISAVRASMAATDCAIWRSESSAMSPSSYQHCGSGNLLQDVVANVPEVRTLDRCDERPVRMSRARKPIVDGRPTRARLDSTLLTSGPNRARRLILSALALANCLLERYENGDEPPARPEAS